jgi:calcineurin-like phosphoesterase family protein|nr:MAG TPA: metallophosphatase domain protein [Bacteriophage sp.]
MVKEFKFDPNLTFFTSDSHWGHKRIIELCKRPFKDVEAMNNSLIENWNKVVPKNGIVFHLGDFAFGGSELWNKVLDQLNGKIYLILGNHDRGNLRENYIKKFELVTPQMQIEIEGRSIYLNHYPFLCYGGSWRNPDSAVWQLFGHCHSGPHVNGADNNRLDILFPYQYDVGVDNNNYTPISWQQVKDKINQQIEKSKSND